MSFLLQHSEIIHIKSKYLCALKHLDLCECVYEQATTSTMRLAKANVVLLLGLMKFATTLNDYITPSF